MRASFLYGQTFLFRLGVVLLNGFLTVRIEDKFPCAGAGVAGLLGRNAGRRGAGDASFTHHVPVCRAERRGALPRVGLSPQILIPSLLSAGRSEAGLDDPMSLGARF